MTLEFNSNLCDGTQKYIDEDGSIINQDGLLDFHGHQAYSSADILLDYFQYNISKTGTFESINGNDRKKIISELETIRENINNESLSPADKIRLGIIEILINSYNNKLFYSGFGRKLVVPQKEVFLDSCEAKNMSGTDDEKYKLCIYKSIIPIFKDIMIQYLGYDSIEVKEPNTISSSSLRINERFYNYILMDFKIDRMQRLRYDSEQKRYLLTKEDFFFQEKEDILRNEILSLKLKYPHKEDRIPFLK